MKKLYKYLILLLMITLTGCSFFRETAELDNSQIQYLGFTKEQNGSDYTINVSGSSEYRVYKYEANVIAIDSNGNEIADDIYGGSLSTSYFEKNEEVTVRCEVTQDVYNKTNDVVVNFVVWAYVGDNEGLVATYRVNFVLNNGEDDISIKVNKGSTVKVDDPYKENMIFEGWYSNKNLTKKFDMNTEIKSNTTVYANYLTDEQAYIQSVKDQVLSANITVKATSKKIGANSYVSTGSGVIFHETDNYYYFLTNNHVTAMASGYTSVSYTVMDYSFKYYYDVTVLHQEANYDLSVGRFKKDTTDLEVIEMENSNPKSGDAVIAIGQPLGVTNTVSLGKVNAYVNVSTSDPTTSNIKFPVIQHTAYTNNGSSGGAILNEDLKLIAVAYAGSTDDNGNFVFSYAVPIEKVHEFLNQYFWNLTLI